jgi:hypothetical protein
MTRAALLAALLAVACHPSPTWAPPCKTAGATGPCALSEPWELPIAVYADLDGYEVFTADVDAALEQWNAEVGVLLFRRSPSPRSPVRITFGSAVPGTSAATRLGRDRFGRRLAVVECRGCVLVGQSADLIGHELGHVLGLAHDPQPGSLMHAAPPHPMAWVTGNQRRRVQTADRRALRRRYQ